MNYGIFVVISLVLNVFIAVLFPEYIGLQDPLGITDIRTQQFNELDGNTKSYYINQGVFNADGTPASNFEDLKDIHLAGEQEAGVTLTDFGFSFLDWVKVGINFFKSIGVFFVAFLVIIYNLVPPFNSLLFIPLSIMYMFSWVKFIMGR